MYDGVGIFYNTVDVVQSNAHLEAKQYVYKRKMINISFNSNSF